MKCPVCGTNGVEGGVCFYCEARSHRVPGRADSATSPAASGPPSAPPPLPFAPDVVVLGGGLAGLAAASRLSGRGRRVLVIEGAPEVGGLAASGTLKTRWGEFDYDNGPHRFHTTDQHVKDEALRLLGDNIHWADRQSRIYLYDRFFHYPLQGGNVVRSLPKLVLVKAFWDYLVVKLRNLVPGLRRPDTNFENWVINRFGRKLYDVFFGTYTEKTWGIPCTEISADWAAQRITLLSLWDTVKKTLFRPKDRNVPRTYVSKFFYPKRGGIGMLARRYREELEKAGAAVWTGSPVTSVLVEDGQVRGVVCRTPDGERTVACISVITTIPVTNLVRLLAPAAPDDVLAAAGRLRHRSMIFVYLVLDRPKVTDDHWIYLPEQKLTTHRLSEFKNFSPDAAPKDKTLLCAEITCDYEDEDWRKSDEELQRIVVEDLKGIGLISGSEVLQTTSRRERYAYPLYDLAYRQNRDRIMAHIDSVAGLSTTGRQGLFRYNNMDQSILMGLTVADNVLGQGADHRQVATGQSYFG